MPAGRLRAQGSRSLAICARMHYTECQSQAGGSGRKGVDSPNPVNVEQHLIRSALYRAASDGGLLKNIERPPYLQISANLTRIWK